ncbi:hypothetical protein GW17_00029317 [Ensete ventricosum]|nr:hypothetical protein GW17_00029317 [Ensete ventricosum]
MGAGGRVDDVGIEQLAVGPAMRERDSVTSLGFCFGQKNLLLLLERKGVGAGGSFDRLSTHGNLLVIGNSQREGEMVPGVKSLLLPVCASSPTSRFLRHGAELVRISGDSGVGSGVLMLEWRSLGGEEAVLLGSVAGSCKEVGSGRSFYSGCCGLFVPDDLTAFMTHHAAAPLAMPAVLVVRRAPAGVGCRPYPCQVGRTATCCRTSRHACRTCGEVCAYRWE